MLNIALGQFEVKPGRPDLNTRKMLSMIHEAKEKNVDLIIFPEMSIPGYLLGDTWEQSSFLKDCEYYGQQIIQASDTIYIMFGNIAMDWTKFNNDGRVRKYNAVFTAYKGKLLPHPKLPYDFGIKALMPNYREFDDTRHFFSLQKLAAELKCPAEELLAPIELCMNGKLQKVGTLICEDGWSDDYQLAPLEILTKKYDIDFFVNISSSPYTLGKNNKRNRVFAKQAKENKVPLLYVNNTGIQNNGKTIYTFDGSSTVYAADGNIIAYGKPYEETLICINLDKNHQTPPISIQEEQETTAIFAALTYGIRKFLQNIHMEKVVLGISGGIDSAVAAALYVNILGPQNVLLINMPSIYNSNTTKDLSSKLAKNLGCNDAMWMNLLN